MLRSLLILMLVFTGSQAHADVTGRFGFVMAPRHNLGEVGDQYPYALMILGFNAGVGLTSDDTPWSLGLNWTTFVYGYFFATGPTQVEQQPDITEMDLGLQLRRQFKDSRHNVTATLGGAFIASNIPLGTNGTTRNFGGYAGLGYEYSLSATWYLGGEFRYSQTTSHIESASLLISINGEMSH